MLLFTTAVSMPEMSRRDGNKRDATAPALFRIDTKNLSLSDARVLDGMIVEPFGLEEAVFRNHALHFEANGTMVESKVSCYILVPR